MKGGLQVKQPMKTVGIYLFDDVEVLDFAGPFEVFSTASRMKLRLEPDSNKPFNVITLARKKGPVTSRGGLTVIPDYDLTNHPPIDIVIIPGGFITAELESHTLITWIQAMSKKVEITASVCTGAFILAKAGLLDEKPATTHWEDQIDLQTMFPRVSVLSEKRWVEVGQVVTSAGISAGISMSLHLVARLESDDLAVKTARLMEYDWKLEEGLSASKKETT
jgi:transcriptional regulator GlxA family with amidase domain